MSETYRIVKTSFVQGDQYVMQDDKYLGRLVEVEEELLTRAEWEASTEVVVSSSVTTIVDYEAAVKFALSEVEKGLVFTEGEYEQAMRTQVYGIVNAALGINIKEDS